MRKKRRKNRKYVPLLLLIAVLILIGICTAKKEEKTADISSEKEEITEKSSEICLNVPALCQYPSLPTGCEATAAAMVLQYYGVEITPEEFVREWLEYNEEFYTEGEVLYGPNPEEVFAGNPFTANSFGCFAPVIVKAINNNSAVCRAEKITGQNLEDLCETYIANGTPLLIWATMGMKESKEGRSWNLEDGTKYTWIAGEHCLVLVGYSEKYYYLNDPQNGSTVGYKKELVEKRFQELGSQAVRIYKK